MTSSHNSAILSQPQLLNGICLHNKQYTCPHMYEIHIQILDMMYRSNPRCPSQSIMKIFYCGLIFQFSKYCYRMMSINISPSIMYLNISDVWLTFAVNHWSKLTFVSHLKCKCVSLTVLSLYSISLIESHGEILDL